MEPRAEGGSDDQSYLHLNEDEETNDMGTDFPAAEFSQQAISSSTESVPIKVELIDQILEKLEKVGYTHNLRTDAWTRRQIETTTYTENGKRMKRRLNLLLKAYDAMKDSITTDKGEALNEAHIQAVFFIVTEKPCWETS